MSFGDCVSGPAVLSLVEIHRENENDITEMQIMFYIDRGYFGVT